MYFKFLLKSLTLVLFVALMWGCAPKRSHGGNEYLLSFLDREYVSFWVNGTLVPALTDGSSKALNVTSLVPEDASFIVLDVRIFPRDDVGGYYAFGVTRLHPGGSTKILFQTHVKLPVTEEYVGSWRIEK